MDRELEGAPNRELREQWREWCGYAVRTIDLADELLAAVAPQPTAGGATP